MTGPSDFTDIELKWLAEVEKYLVGLKVPDDIEAKLVSTGVADKTDLGIKLTGLGKIILAEARRLGRAPARTTPRPG